MLGLWLTLALIAGTFFLGQALLRDSNNPVRRRIQDIRKRIAMAEDKKQLVELRRELEQIEADITEEDGAPGTDSDVSMLLDMLTVKTAKDLSLDMSVNSGR